ncbi:MAG: M16 family metallopeptidase [Bradymonadia bacterium]
MSQILTEPPWATRALSNGLTAVAVQRPGARSAHLNVAVRLGVRFEAPEDNGLSHFLEHALFLGCEGYPNADAVNEAAERMGEVIEASTGRDTVQFEHTLAPSRLRAGLDLMAAMLTAPRFEGLEPERAIILEEALDELDDRGRLIDADTLSRMDLWPGISMGQRIIGPESNIERFDLDDLHRMHRRHFQGPNMVVTVVADADPQILLDDIEAAFSKLPGGDARALTPLPEFAAGPLLRQVPDSGSQVECRLAFRTPGFRHPDAPIIDMIKRILDDGMASRIQRRLGNDLGLAYDQWAAWDRYPDTGAFEIGATVSPGKAITLVKEAYALLEGLVTDPPDDAELSRVRFRAQWAAETGGEHGEVLAARYGTRRLYWPDARPVAERLAAQLDVSAEDIARVAASLFQGKNHVACVVGDLSRPAGRTLERTVAAFGR